MIAPTASQLLQPLVDRPPVPPVRGEGKVRLTQSRALPALRLVLALSGQGQVGLESLLPFRLPGLRAGLDEQAFACSLPIGRVHYEGSQGDRMLGQWSDSDIAARDLIALLSGRLPAGPDPGDPLVEATPHSWDVGGWQLAMTRLGLPLRLWLDASGRLARAELFPGGYDVRPGAEVDRVPLLRVQLSAWRDDIGLELPGIIDLGTARSSLRIEIRRWARVDAIEERLLRPRSPRGWRRVDLDRRLRQAP